jgi:hypothetical protein
MATRKRDWSRLITTVCVLFALVLCIGITQATRPIKTRWPGVTPAPSEPIGLLYGFGDRQLAYYNLTLTLQNMGDMGGRVTALKNYDMNSVADWLWLTYKFDRMSHYAPTLGSYYFGATQDPSKLRPVIQYLAVAGNTTERELWRYLAQAVYLARFRLDDQVLALDLAYKLAALNGRNMPIWTKQMPAFVMSKNGQKQASRDLFITLLATSKNISIQEVNFMCGYITDHLREPGDKLEANEVWQTLCAGRNY